MNIHYGVRTAKVLLCTDSLPPNVSLSFCCDLCLADFSVNIRQSPSACSVQMTLDFAYTTSSFTKAEGPPCQAKLRLCALLNFLKRLLSSKHHVLNETTRCSYDSSDKFFGHVEHNTSRLEFNWARCNALDVTDLVAVGARRWQNLVLSITLNATGTPVSSIQAQLPTGEEQAQERISSSTYKDLLLEHMQNYTDAGLIHLAMPLDQQDTREVLAAHLHSLPHTHRNRRRRSTAGRQCRKSFVKVPSADLGLILDWKIIAPRELNLSYCSGGCVDGEHVPPTNYHRFLAAFRHTTRPFGSISPGPPLPACVPSGYSVIEYVIVGSVPTPELRLQHGVAGCACY